MSQLIRFPLAHAAEVVQEIPRMTCLLIDVFLENGGPIQEAPWKILGFSDPSRNGEYEFNSLGIIIPATLTAWVLVILFQP